jgi:small-conductance mechanosensitive channel
MPDLRHHRRHDSLIAVTTALVALAALIVGRGLGKVHATTTHPKVIVWICAAVLVISGVIASRRIGRALGDRVAHRSSAQAGGVLRLVVTAAGLVLLFFAVLAVLGVSLGQLLIGAGVAGVVLGIAAQQSLANVFASIVLLLARPFRVGDKVQLRSGAIGIINVTILELGLTYLTVMTDGGVLKIPNSAVLASGIGVPHPPNPPTASNDDSVST